MWSSEKHRLNLTFDKKYVEFLINKPYGKPYYILATCNMIYGYEVPT